MQFLKEVGKRGVGPPELLARHPSSALREMGAILESRERPRVLDLGPLCDGNIQHFAARGCRVSVEAAEDLRRAGGPRSAPAAPPQRLSPGVPGAGAGEGAGEPAAGPVFSLDYEDGRFDGILLWDAVDYLDDDLARQLGREVHRVSRAGSLLSMFSEQTRSASPAPLLRYRLDPEGLLSAEPLPGPPLARIGRENRDLFRLLPGFEVVRCTLLRSQLRELLMVRKG